MSHVKLLGIAGSLRQKSTNRGLLRAAQMQLPDGASMVLADLADIPFYNPDIAEKPAGEKRVQGQMGKAVAIVGAGGGMGTSRAQYHLRQVYLQPLNRPEIFANAFAGAFDADGNLTDAKLTRLVSDQMRALVAKVGALRG